MQDKKSSQLHTPEPSLPVLKLNDFQNVQKQTSQPMVDRVSLDVNEPHNHGEEVNHLECALAKSHCNDGIHGEIFLTLMV